MVVISVNRVQGTYEGHDYDKLIVYCMKDVKNTSYQCKDGTKVEMLTGTQVDKLKVNASLLDVVLKAYNEHKEIEPLFNSYGQCVNLNIVE